MEQENERGKVFSQQLKNREIYPLEYEIPFTDYNWDFYFDVLWSDLIEKQQKKGVIKDIVELIKKREGWVIDLGAGKSDFIQKLNQFTPKGLRLDLQYNKKSRVINHPYRFIIYPQDLENLSKQEKENYLKQREESRAVAGDILALPLPNEVAQLLVSNEVLPYLLEKGEVYEKFIKLRQKSAELVETEYQYRKSFSPEMATKYIEVVKDFKDYEKELGLDFILKPKYDLKILEIFFKESSRVLKSNLHPKAEMRVFPFYLIFLIRLTREKDNSMSAKKWQAQERVDNIIRIEKFLKIITENFTKAIYKSHIFPENLLRVRAAPSFSLARFLKENLPRKMLTQFLTIFNLDDPFFYQRGLLILQK